MDTLPSVCAHVCICVFCEYIVTMLHAQTCVTIIICFSLSFAESLLGGDFIFPCQTLISRLV